jgi:hypothetical protein
MRDEAGARDVPAPSLTGPTMSLLSPTEAKLLVSTDKSDAALQLMLDAIDADVVAHFGEHYVDGVTSVVETINPDGGRNLYLRRKATSIVSIAETYYLGATPVTLAASTYYLWGDAGMIERIVAPQFIGLYGLGKGLWGVTATVTYIPFNDNALRKQVMANLLRLELERTSLRSESIAGEYSYSTKDTVDEDRQRLMRKLRLGVL